VTKRKPPPKKTKFKNQPFAELAKIKTAAKKKKKITPQENHGPDIQQDEESLFAKAMTGVVPISNRDPSHPPEPQLGSHKTHEEQEREEVRKALQDLVEGERPLALHETDEAIEGSVEGLDPRILSKLRRGEFSIQDHLDLHGYTREEAREKVAVFINQAMLHGKRCVLIIHGRGHGSKGHVPVLKNALRNWFTRRGLRKKILAFTTARACDGGAGAIYVLLKKFRPR
jgi:DNA-nicking Smr family endonuclease